MRAEEYKSSQFPADMGKGFRSHLESSGDSSKGFRQVNDSLIHVSGCYVEIGQWGGQEWSQETGQEAFMGVQAGDGDGSRE